MRNFWYNLLCKSADLFGSWFFVVVSRLIAAGYFVFSRSRKESLRFYEVLFPDQGRLYHLLCTFRQFQNFTTIHLDRFLARKKRNIEFTSSGWKQIEQNRQGKGAILLMSHLGNWEMAAHLLKEQQNDLQLMLYMGIKEKEGVERLQKEELRRAGIQIIGVRQGTNAPFSVVEGVRFLHNGGLVSLSGDILWHGEQRRVEVEFLGRRASVPAAPYIFALVSGAPLHAFFSFRTGPNRYHFTLSRPITVQARTRAERDQAIADAAQQYADLLEQALREHPFEWYHFKRFIH